MNDLRHIETGEQGAYRVVLRAESSILHFASFGRLPDSSTDGLLPIDLPRMLLPNQLDLYHSTSASFTALELSRPFSEF